MVFSRTLSGVSRLRQGVPFVKRMSSSACTAPIGRRSLGVRYGRTLELLKTKVSRTMYRRCREALKSTAGGEMVLSLKQTRISKNERNTPSCLLKAVTHTRHDAGALCVVEAKGGEKKLPRQSAQPDDDQTISNEGLGSDARAGQPETVGALYQGEWKKTTAH